jgi:hypothetical protein
MDMTLKGKKHKISLPKTRPVVTQRQVQERVNHAEYSILTKLSVLEYCMLTFMIYCMLLMHWGKSY